MKLSDGEKLILLMLADIYESTGVKSDSDIDPNFVRQAIYSGHLWGLSQKYYGIFHEDTSEEVASEAASIMSMWQMLEDRFKTLTAEEKERLEREADPFGKHVRFTGFDGNDGRGHYGAARFYVEQMGLFQDFADRDLNSHAPLLEGDLRMLAKYNEIIRCGDTFGVLKVDDMIEILKARFHPENR